MCQNLHYGGARGMIQTRFARPTDRYMPQSNDLTWQVLHEKKQALWADTVASESSDGVCLQSLQYLDLVQEAGLLSACALEHYFDGTILLEKAAMVDLESPEQIALMLLRQIGIVFLI